MPKKRPKNKETELRPLSEDGEKHGPKWLMGKNDKFGLHDLFRLARQANYSPFGQNFPFGQEEESGGEGNTIYEDDVTYNGLPAGAPGSGQYVGDYGQTGIQGMPAMPALPSQPGQPGTPGTPAAPTSGSIGGDPMEGFWPAQEQGPVSMAPGVQDLLSQMSFTPNQVAPAPGQVNAQPHVPVQSKGGPMSPVDLARLASQAGFKGEGLRQMVATIFPESGGRPDAFNGNAGTGDRSYGLAQINMLGNLGPERLKQFGIHRNEDLFDPLTNLKAAYEVSGHGTNFSPWSAWKAGKHQQYLDEADAAIAQLTQEMSNPAPPAEKDPAAKDEEEDED